MGQNLKAALISSVRLDVAGHAAMERSLGQEPDPKVGVCYQFLAEIDGHMYRVEAERLGKKEEGGRMITEEEVERAVIEAFRAVFRKWNREEK